MKLDAWTWGTLLDALYAERLKTYDPGVIAPELLTQLAHLKALIAGRGGLIGSDEIVRMGLEKFGITWDEYEGRFK